jgi:F-type H+-transporting ATPase subunit c
MKNINRSLFTKVASFMGLFLVGGVSFAFGAEGAAEATGSGTSAEVLKWLALGAPLGFGLAAIGCALGQGRMAAQAMAGIARNPQASGQMFVPMILGLAFIEAIAIYGLIFVFIFKAALLG